MIPSCHSNPPFYFGTSLPNRSIISVYSLTVIFIKVLFVASLIYFSNDYFPLATGPSKRIDLSNWNALINFNRFSFTVGAFLQKVYFPFSEIINSFLFIGIEKGPIENYSIEFSYCFSPILKRPYSNKRHSICLFIKQLI